MGNTLQIMTSSPPGVRASGLQYQILAAGKGTESPVNGSVVTINYIGKTIDGRIFGTPQKSGRTSPEPYDIGKLAPGVQEALRLMKKGDHWLLFIPPELGFPRGRGPLEFRAIIFDVELVDFKKG